MSCSSNHSRPYFTKALEFFRETFATGLLLRIRHKLQLLDVVLYGPLEASDNMSRNDFMVTYTGHTISIRNVTGLLGKTYLQVANARLVIKGFTATRIEQFNTSIFTEEDFTPSLTSEHLMRKLKMKFLRLIRILGR
ncbi:hypothetical protein AVEN_33221-1 [Araneus ventricosus]|uniref:Uncharacterized protein n=1 Tax=Araneus ventricosus TaxID=182803 RepID=A0A4Y2VUF4_ARAVE|nr:hypothetical protein AVEN_207060-1 [Araneus ventricosus]GBO27510.1 hypothetical protein AVEN_33221-1 [Araneus ventricosus]